MAKLIAKPPLDAGLPFTAGTCTLAAVDPGRMTALAPWPGAEAALSRALRDAHGLDFPASGRVTDAPGARALWSGRSQALLIGPDPAPGLAAHAALTDQSDAWAVFRLEGADAIAVLARLVPIDLHPAIFTTGRTARTLLGHMTCGLTHVGARAFEVMVFRSMAGTALHEIATAMKSVAAQRR